MPEAALSCPQCRASWPTDPAALAALSHCPACNSHVQVEVFPAFTRPVAVGAVGEAIVIEGEAACFYHPQKRAAVPCGICGRFLCALCDLELNGQHVCPNCLETGRKKGQLENLDTRRTLYDSAALTLALVGPLLCGWGAIPLAPLAIGVAIYSWRKPGSLIPRTRFRSVLAIVLALAELIGAFLIFWGMSTRP
jgi:hypothetical protein